MTMKNSVFISHASEDKYFVKLLIDILTYHGVKVWYDDNDIYPGDKFSVSVELLA